MLVWFVWVTAVFATYRVSFMITQEDGPAYLFKRIRKMAHDRTIDTPQQWVYEGINCVLCVSFWLSWVTAALIWLSGVHDVPIWLMALSIAGTCQFLQRYLYG